MIDILLSTYNGEKYLKEQIDSIIHQTYTDWTLIIRHDGSKDNTQNIIRSYTDRYSNIIQIQSSENIGVIKSFETLLKHSNSDYFMFCDQDDVWLSNKLELSIAKIKEMESTTRTDCPIVVHTDLTVVDSNLDTIQPSMFKMFNLKPSLIYSNINYALLYNAITGCTLIGNRAARNFAIPFPSNISMHDSWLAQSALLNKGRVGTIYTPTILYRQHGGNVLGATADTSINGRLRKYINDYNFYKVFAGSFAFIKYFYWKCRFFLKLRICNG